MNDKLKVLIGDDSAGIGISIANKLRERGLYTYTRRKDCDVIYESVRRDPPDVAVIDVNTPGGDIIGLMKRINDMGGKSPVFIITSACDNEFIERQVMDNGAARFMLQPYEADDLYNAISSAVGERGGSMSDDMEIVVTDMIHNTDEQKRYTCLDEMIRRSYGEE